MPNITTNHAITYTNRVKSDLFPVSIGIPQGSVLGTTLFVLFTNELPSSVLSGSVYMCTDDTCVGETADLAIDQLNKALREFYNLIVSKQPVNATSQKEQGHPFHQGDTDRSSRSCVLRKLSVKFGYHDENVRSDSRPETHLDGQRVCQKNWTCSNVLVFYQKEF